MDPRKETQMNANETKVATQDIATAKPTSAETRIHWASADDTVSPELEQKFEAMRARNWVTDKMVQKYQKLWHCSRGVALERLINKTSL